MPETPKRIWELGVDQKDVHPSSLPPLLQISDIGVSPRRPSRTIWILSSAENFRRVAFLITQFLSGIKVPIIELKSAFSSIFLHAGKYLSSPLT
jgi:hypothetical protein